MHIPWDYSAYLKPWQQAVCSVSYLIECDKQNKTPLQSYQVVTIPTKKFKSVHFVSPTTRIVRGNLLYAGYFFLYNITHPKILTNYLSESSYIYNTNIY